MPARVFQPPRTERFPGRSPLTLYESGPGPYRLDPRRPGSGQWASAPPMPSIPAERGSEMAHPPARCGPHRPIPPSGSDPREPADPKPKPDLVRVPQWPGNWPDGPLPGSTPAHSPDSGGMVMSPLLRTIPRMASPTGVPPGSRARMCAMFSSAIQRERRPAWVLFPAPSTPSTTMNKPRSTGLTRNTPGRDG